eukprot:17249-Eustigmatos_ZCMA.PRE.1
MTRVEFRMCLLRLGFSLTDVTDEDLDLIDADGNGQISIEECCKFLQVGAESRQLPLVPFKPPVDDRMFKAHSLDGTLRVKVGAQIMRGVNSLS